MVQAINTMENSNYTKVIDLTKSMDTYNNSKAVSVKSQQHRFIINSKQVILIKSESNYSTIYYKSSNIEKVFTSRTLKHWSSLFDSKDLIKVHNSYLINKSKITSINTSKNSMILDGKFEVPYSRGNKKLVNKLEVIN